MCFSTTALDRSSGKYNTMFPLAETLAEHTHVTSAGVTSRSPHWCPAPGDADNRTKWEKPGNLLTCALWGHVHSEAFVFFTGYFLQPQWETGSGGEGQFPKSTTTFQERNPGNFFSSSHRFTNILFLQLCVMQIRVTISTYIYSTMFSQKYVCFT